MTPPLSDPFLQEHAFRDNVMFRVMGQQLLTQRMGALEDHRPVVVLTTGTSPVAHRRHRGSRVGVMRMCEMILDMTPGPSRPTRSARQRRRRTAWLHCAAAGLHVRSTVKTASTAIHCRAGTRNRRAVASLGNYK